MELWLSRVQVAFHSEQNGGKHRHGSDLSDTHFLYACAGVECPTVGQNWSIGISWFIRLWHWEHGEEVNSYPQAPMLTRIQYLNGTHFSFLECPNTIVTLLNVILASFSQYHIQVLQSVTIWVAHQGELLLCCSRTLTLVIIACLCWESKCFWHLPLDTFVCVILNNELSEMKRKNVCYCRTTQSWIFHGFYNLKDRNKLK